MMGTEPETTSVERKLLGWKDRMNFGNEDSADDLSTLH